MSHQETGKKSGSYRPVPPLNLLLTEQNRLLGEMRAAQEALMRSITLLAGRLGGVFGLCEDSAALYRAAIEAVDGLDNQARNFLAMTGTLSAFMERLAAREEKAAVERNPWWAKVLAAAGFLAVQAAGTYIALRLFIYGSVF